MKTIYDRIAGVKSLIEVIELNQYPDYGLANYLLRDWPELEAAGLSDLSWAYHQEGNITKYELEELIRLLEDWLEENDGRNNCDTLSQ